MWANEPLGSGQLVALANEALGWKKSTTYTVLKKLCERGILHIATGTVPHRVKKPKVKPAPNNNLTRRPKRKCKIRWVAVSLKKQNRQNTENRKK